MKSLCVVPLLLLAGLQAAAASQYVVEAYFIVEPQVIKKYETFGYDQATAISTIRADVDYLVFQVNKLFQSMTMYGLDVQVRAKHVNIMSPTDVMFEDCVLVYGTDLQADMGLAKFQEWLKNTGAKAQYGHDIAIVWTGYDLFSTTGNNNVAGYATVGATCTDNGISIVEFDGTMGTAVTTAHEIAHSLGAPHVTYDPNSPCSSENGFIMNPTSSSHNENRWSFSSCSAEEMLKYINSLSTDNNNCLVQTSTPASSFQLADAVSTDIMDADKICTRTKKDTNSYFCHYFDFFNPPKGDEVCQTLKCGLKGSTYCCSAMPSDGMICDANKRCDKGRCVASSIPTGDVDTDCVFGDVDSEYVQGVPGQTCEQYVNADVSRCYQTWVSADRCCATCGAKKTGIAGCEYGDHNPVCKNYPPSAICGSSSDVCCETCHNYVGRRSANSNGVVIPDVAKEHVNDTPKDHPTLEDDPKDNSSDNGAMP